MSHHDHENQNEKVETPKKITYTYLLVFQGFDENFNDCGSNDYELMSINTIINGKVSTGYPDSNDF